MLKIKNTLKDYIKKLLKMVLEKDYGYLVSDDDLPNTFMARAALDGTKECIIFSVHWRTITYFIGTNTFEDCEKLGIDLVESLTDELYAKYQDAISDIISSCVAKGLEVAAPIVRGECIIRIDTKLTGNFPKIEFVNTDGDAEETIILDPTTYVNSFEAHPYATMWRAFEKEREYLSMEE